MGYKGEGDMDVTNLHKGTTISRKPYEVKKLLQTEVILTLLRDVILSELW